MRSSQLLFLDRWLRNGKHWLNAMLMSRQLTDTRCAFSALDSPPRMARPIAKLATLKPLKSRPSARRWTTSSSVTSPPRIWRKSSTSCCPIQSLRISRSRATASIHCTMFTSARWVALSQEAITNAKRSLCSLGESVEEATFRFVQIVGTSRRWRKICWTNSDR